MQSAEEQRRAASTWRQVFDYDRYENPVFTQADPRVVYARQPGGDGQHVFAGPQDALVGHPDEGVESIDAEVARLVKQPAEPGGLLRVVIESVHTGQVCNLKVSPRVSVEWLAQKARAGAGLKDSVDVGSTTRLRIRWVLVDASAFGDWKELPGRMKQDIYAYVKSPGGVEVSFSNLDRLEDLGVHDGIVFYLVAVPDQRDDDVMYHIRGFFR